MQFSTPRQISTLLAALLLAPQVLGASCSGDLTITRTQDLSSLSACSTYFGSVTVQSISISVPTNSYNPGLTLDGVEKVTGDVVFDAISIPKGTGSLIISAPKLKKVHKLAFTNMSPLEMPKLPLEKVLDLTFRNIGFRDYTQFNPRQWPQLQQVSWIKVINTTMTKIGGWDRSLVLPAPESFYKTFPNFSPGLLLTAKDNPLLDEISLKGYSNSTSSIIADVAANGKDLRVDFPLFDHSILWLSNAAQFSAPDMKTLSINQDLWRTFIDINERTDGDPGFVDNIFTTLDLPKVTSIGNAFDVANNTYLGDLHLPALTTVDNLQIQNNRELKSIALPQLTDIAGQLDVSGSFDSISLPSLTDTSGDLTIHATAGKFSCSAFDSRQKDTLFIKGKYSCSTSGLSTGAKAGIGVGVGLAVVASVLFCLLWLRHRRKRMRDSGVEEVPKVNRSSWKELESEPAQKVEAGGTELHELDAKTSPFDTVSSVMELESPSVATELAITPHQTEFPCPRYEA